MTTVIEELERRLQPQYVGWQDQYRAILHALGVNPDDDWERRIPWAREHMAWRVPDEAWREAVEGDPSFLVLEPLFALNGVQMHVQAIQVTDDMFTVMGTGESFGLQNGVTVELDAMLDHLSAAFNPDGGWQTTTINGREYVVFMEPYSR